MENNRLSAKFIAAKIKEIEAANTAAELKMVLDNKCAFCNNELQPGARGGLSRNYDCMACGAKFNRTPFGVEVLTAPTSRVIH